MKQLVVDRGLDGQVEIDSAGMIGYHAGGRADARMRRAASNRGYQLDSVARQFDFCDFERFDLIVAMDRSNLSDLQALDIDQQHGHKIRMLGSFLPGDDTPDVPDPYYGGERGFDQVIDMIEQACPRILDHLLS